MPTINYRDLPYTTRVDDAAGRNRELYGKMYNAFMDEGKTSLDFTSLLPWKNIGWNFYKFEPGKWLRPHMDHFMFYRKYNNLKTNDNILRCNVFLEDWAPGHVFGIEEKVITGWKKYDYFPDPISNQFRRWWDRLALLLFKRGWPSNQYYH